MRVSLWRRRSAASSPSPRHRRYPDRVVHSLSPIRRTLAGIIALVALSLVLLPSTALAQDPSPPAPESSSAPAAIAAELRPGETWDVVSFDAWGEGLVAPRPDTSLTVSLLAAGRLEGETGCGTYYGRYTVDGPSIGLGVVTKGPDPCSVAVNEEAVAFSVALDAVTGWRTTDRGLELLDAEGGVRMLLEPRGAQGITGDWVAERYWRANGRPAEPLPGSPIELRFGPDGAVSGSSGCRLLEGEYLISSDQVIVGVDTVGLPCEGDLRRQERRLRRALDAVVLWQRDGERLLLTDGFGEPLLELSAAPPVDPGDGTGG